MGKKARKKRAKLQATSHERTACGDGSVSEHANLREAFDAAINRGCTKALKELTGLTPPQMRTIAYGGINIGETSTWDDDKLDTARTKLISALAECGFIIREPSRKAAQLETRAGLDRLVPRIA